MAKYMYFSTNAGDGVPNAEAEGYMNKVDNFIGCTPAGATTTTLYFKPLKMPFIVDPSSDINDAVVLTHATSTNANVGFRAVCKIMAELANREPHGEPFIVVADHSAGTGNVGVFADAAITGVTSITLAA